MDYIGSKVKLNEWMFAKILKLVKHPKSMVFLDGCAGSGAVSRHAVQHGFEIISNDLMCFSSAVCNGSIGLEKKELQSAFSHISFMKTIAKRKGFFYKNFSPASVFPRWYFTENNAQYIDAFRSYIDSVKNSKVKDYLLYRCIEAISQVSNTTGVQAAYLKKFKLRATDDIRDRLVATETISGVVKSYTEDIVSLIQRLNGYDILYIDPPYNTRQYGPNYHLYETFVRNDNPSLNGKTGLRKWKGESSSSFCSKKTCATFLKQIIDASTSKWFFFSYNSDGILSESEIISIISRKYNCRCQKMRYRRYKADSAESRQYNESVLFELFFFGERKITEVQASARID